jgi:gamma-glutamylcyclotransferase (GGCT)/AIG2-like uncharacterized protein YtfP
MENNENKTLVAVYGSLRQGMGNHRLLEGQDFLGKTTVSGFSMYRYCNGYPACILDGGTNTIITEVYSVDDSCFASLDMLEGYPSFYNRSQVKTELGEVWVYHMSEDGVGDAPLIPSGDWVDDYTDRMTW